MITVNLAKEALTDSRKTVLPHLTEDVEVRCLTGDRIVIKKASVSVKILKLNHLSFVEVLRQKMSNN